MLRFEGVGTSQPKSPGKRFQAEGTARAQTISWKEEGVTYKRVSRKMQRGIVMVGKRDTKRARPGGSEPDPAGPCSLC